jgi:hypothetical protein
VKLEAWAVGVNACSREGPGRKPVTREDDDDDADAAADDDDNNSYCCCWGALWTGVLSGLWNEQNFIIGNLIRNFDDNINFMSCLLGINTPTNSTKTILGLHRGINCFSSAICPLETSSPWCSHYSDTESWTPNWLHVYADLDRVYAV